MDSKKRKQVVALFKLSLYYVYHIWTLTLKLITELMVSLSASALCMIVIVVGVIVSLLIADQKDLLY